MSFSLSWLSAEVVEREENLSADQQKKSQSDDEEEENNNADGDNK